jgi:hypothetical protein
MKTFRSIVTGGAETPRGRKVANGGLPIGGTVTTLRPLKAWSQFVYALLFSTALAIAGTMEEHAALVSPLVDPAKLAGLGERGGNQRVQKYVAQLAVAKQAGHAPEKVAARAVKQVGMKGGAAKLTTAAMVRNLTIAEKLGCVNAAGLRDMQKGQAPTIQWGPYRGDQLSVDHIIPVSVVPELDNVIANLELMPLRMNQSKKASIGQRQRDLAGKLSKAGLLSRAGLKKVQ